MKRGIRRIKPATFHRSPTASAALALHFLKLARFHAKQAGACYTAARIRAAISSAKGAVRAAEYREGRT